MDHHHLSISELFIETTRKCNLQCAHCMRGKAQDITMDFDLLRKFLQQVDSIYCVTFSGGEPSLAPEVIQEFTNLVKEFKIDVSGFFVVTNGKHISRELATALMDLYSYCSDDFPESFGLVWSRDQYHWPHGNPNERMKTIYHALSFFRPNDRLTYYSQDSLLAEGFAEENQLATAPVEPSRLEVEMDDETINVIGEVYLNCLGEIVPGCNFSYKNQSKHSLGNIKNKTLFDIFSALVENEEE